MPGPRSAGERSLAPLYRKRDDEPAPAHSLDAKGRARPAAGGNAGGRGSAQSGRGAVSARAPCSCLCPARSVSPNRHSSTPTPFDTSAGAPASALGGFIATNLSSLVRPSHQSPCTYQEDHISPANIGPGHHSAARKSACAAWTCMGVRDRAAEQLRLDRFHPGCKVRQVPHPGWAVFKHRHCRFGPAARSGIPPCPGGDCHESST